MSGAEMVGVGQQQRAAASRPRRPIPTTRCATFSPRWSAEPRGSGRRCCRRRRASNTSRRRWSSTTARRGRDAAARSRRWGRSIARSTRRSISTPSFFRDMKTKYGGGGDFAYAYVVAHEIGHHVQDLLGILDKVDNIKQQVSQTQANALSVRVELQADCLRRRLGQPRQREVEIAPTGRHREGARDRAGDRRRPAADRRARLRRARQLHPRLVGAAPAMADRRPEERRHQVLRHVLELSGGQSPTRACGGPSDVSQIRAAAFRWRRALGAGRSMELESAGDSAGCRPDPGGATGRAHEGLRTTITLIKRRWISRVFAGPPIGIVARQSQASSPSSNILSAT